MNKHEIVDAYSISSGAEQGRSKAGKILLEATYIAAGCHIAGAKDKIAEPVNRKERSLVSKAFHSSQTYFPSK